MNNKDFNKLINTFNSIVDNAKSYNFKANKIISISSSISDEFVNYLIKQNSNDISIFFSNDKNSIYNFGIEKSFQFFSFEEYFNEKDKILNLISNTSFLNQDLDNKVFLFGGFNFDMKIQNKDFWEGIPSINFQLPKLTVHKNKLRINLYLKSSTSKNNIKLIISDYIDDLRKPNDELIKGKNIIKEIKDLMSKKLYSSRLNDLLETIKDKKNSIYKIVCSRTRKITFSNSISYFEIFRKLCFNNSKNMSFIYDFGNGRVMIGSTPELILSKKSNFIQSESIAGSNFDNKTDDFIIDEKEIKEQKFVTDYIENFFKKNTNDIRFNRNPKIKKLSNIEHLCTSFEGELSNDKNILDLLNDLHPTPAICGISKYESLKIIRDLDENRGWYGGPIGWIDNNLDGEFYLNIRSGLVDNDILYLFSGSGITEKSRIENEWKETEQKFKLMMNTFIYEK